MTKFSYLRQHAAAAAVTGVIVVMVAVIGGRAIFSRPEAQINTSPTKVTLVNAGTFRRGNLNVAANGVVESQSQADLKSQLSAPVATVNVAVGDTVYAGQVIMELSNADVRAQLAQAQAGLAVAQGQQYTGSVSVESAKQGAIDKIRDAYVKSYDIVNSQIDPILYNNDGNGGQLQSYTFDQKLRGEIVAIRIDLTTDFKNWKTVVDSLVNTSSESEIMSVAQLSQKNLGKVDLLLSDMAEILNDISSHTTVTSGVGSANTWKTTVSTARGIVSGAAQALTGAGAALATGNASQNTTASAGVAAAQAGVNNLQAQLAKTVITSPITGRIASLPLRAGELAQPGALLATVVGDTTNLQIKARASGDDLSRIKVGQSALIQGSIKGVVTGVAPSVDPLTKKAEVNIDVMDAANTKLVVGQNVGVAIVTGAAAVVENSDKPVTYVLPIQNVKIIPGDAFVYTVDQNSKIKRLPVILGEIQGDFIEVISGLNDTINLVTPVYELDEGQTVVVQ
jgi:multidrug efflux pump subunit AcrA (membrane-fusion protein)